MEKIDHAIHSSGIASTDEDLLKVFLKSYYRSNRKFPQTRCYFIVDFASKIQPDDLMRVLTEDVAIPQKAIQSLAKIANLHHKDRRVSKSVTSDMIRADVSKMLAALKETYGRYCEIKANEACHAAFITDCNLLRITIDEHNISQHYLDFVSPNHVDESGKTEVLRTRNIFLEDRVLNISTEKSILLLALEKEITKSLWVLRTR